MASFTPRNLSTLAYAQGFPHWHYRAEGGAEGLNAATQPGFFATFINDHGMVQPGDVVLVSNGAGAREVVILDGGAPALLRRVA